MSEGGVGWVEREALDRARERMVARRATYYRQLEDIAELDRLGVAQHTGDRTTERLVQWRVDLAEARRLVTESDDLTPRTSGRPLTVLTSLSYISLLHLREALSPRCRLRT